MLLRVRKVIKHPNNTAVYDRKESILADRRTKKAKFKLKTLLNVHHYCKHSRMNEDGDIYMYTGSD